MSKNFLLDQIAGLKAILKTRESELRESQEHNRVLKKDLDDATKLLIYDPLTGIESYLSLCNHINRAYSLLKRGEHHVHSGILKNTNEQEFSVLFLDVDYFKLINDTYGHAGGDLAIKEVARFLDGYFNRESDVVSRRSGDEFIVLLAGVTPREKANRIKQKFLRAMEGFEVALTDKDRKEVLVQVQCSVGVASTSDGHKNTEELLHAADLDMLAHKESRKAAR